MKSTSPRLRLSCSHISDLPERRALQHAPYLPRRGRSPATHVACLRLARSLLPNSGKPEFGGRRVGATAQSSAGFTPPRPRSAPAAPPLPGGVGGPLGATAL